MKSTGRKILLGLLLALLTLIVTGSKTAAMLILWLVFFLGILI